MADFTFDDYRQLMVKMLASLNVRKTPRSLKGQITLHAMKRHFRRICAAIDSMTPEERADPVGVVDARRGRRIAAGAGVPLADVRRLVRGFPGFASMVNRMRSPHRSESD